MAQHQTYRLVGQQRAVRAWGDMARCEEICERYISTYTRIPCNWPAPRSTSLPREIWGDMRRTDMRRYMGRYISTYNGPAPRSTSKYEPAVGGGSGLACGLHSYPCQLGTAPVARYLRCAASHLWARLGVRSSLKQVLLSQSVLLSTTVSPSVSRTEAGTSRRAQRGKRRILLSK